MKSFTTITNIGYYDSLKNDAALSGETLWTINKNAHAGDAVFLYVCAPVQAIVATAILSEDVYLEEDLQSEFWGSYFAPMENLKMLDTPLRREVLLKQFPEWRYWRQPRQSVEVPQRFVGLLEILTK